MSEIKEYQASIDFGFHYFTVDVQIDHSIMTESNLAEINNFFSGSKDCLDSAKGNLVNAVLKRLCIDVFELIIVSGSVDVTDYFSNHSYTITEGWPPMDGSRGIKLISHDTFSIEYDDVDIFEVK